MRSSTPSGCAARSVAGGGRGRAGAARRDLGAWAPRARPRRASAVTTAARGGRRPGSRSGVWPTPGTWARCCAPPTPSAPFVALSAGCADPTRAEGAAEPRAPIFRVPLLPFDAAPRPWTALATRVARRSPRSSFRRRDVRPRRRARRAAARTSRRSCDAVATIPQAGEAESLNVAMAGAIALYEWARRAGGLASERGRASATSGSRPAKSSGRMDAREQRAGDRRPRARGLRARAAGHEARGAVRVPRAPGRARRSSRADPRELHRRRRRRARWPIGQQVRVGGALFEITMVCDPCERMEAIRPGLQAKLEGRRGMLARVLESGASRRRRSLL